MNKLMILSLIFATINACSHINAKEKAESAERIPASLREGTNVSGVFCYKGQFTIDAVARLNEAISNREGQLLFLRVGSGYTTVSTRNLSSNGQISISMEEEIDYSVQPARNQPASRKSPYYLACTWGTGVITAIQSGNNISP